MRWLFYGNIFIALGAGAATWQAYATLGLPAQPFIIAFAALSTFFVYNIDRVVAWESMKALQGARHRWLVAHHRPLWVLCVVSALVLGVMALGMGWQAWLLLGHLGVLSLAYSVPFLPHATGVKRPLRGLPGLKIFLIAYVWAVATVGLPALLAGVPLFAPHTLALMAERGLFIFALTLPFDVRDMAGDRAAGVLTLPHVLGERGTAFLIGLCYAACVALAWQAYPTPPMFWAYAGSCVAALAATFGGWRVPHDMHYSATLDGMIVLQAAAVLAAATLA